MGIKARESRAMRGLKQVVLDENGKVVPERQDLELIERDYPLAPDGKKWQLAQAARLIRAVQGE